MQFAPIAGVGPGMRDLRGEPSLSIFRNRDLSMPRKTIRPSFDQVMETLRSHRFTVSSFNGVPGGMLVSKSGVAAILVPSRDDQSGPASFFERPGILVRGEVARLLDRGYQKFIKTHQYELPATASQLQAIHTFNEELTMLIGGGSLYNESLGTTSDVYEYDRLRGREDEAPAPKRPWELASDH
jgi:hypothetical protein